MADREISPITKKLIEDVKEINDWCKAFYKDNNVDKITRHLSIENDLKCYDRHVSISIDEEGIGVCISYVWEYAKDFSEETLHTHDTEMKLLVLNWKAIKQCIYDSWAKVQEKYNAIMEFEV